MNETPTDMWSLWLGYFGQHLDASLSYRYCDSTFDDEYAQYVDTTDKADDEHHVIDIKVTVRLREHTSLSLSEDNLFDEEYYYYYRTPGFFGLATVSVAF